MQLRRTLVGLVFAVLVIGVIGWGQGVVINEVAWAGTLASPSDEWIELFNTSNSTVDLTGWTLAFGKKVIDLGSGKETVIAPGGYFLLERSNDNTIADVTADLIYTGTLSNGGAVIKLIDATGKVVDTANAKQEKGWAAGSAATGELPYASMERIDPRGPDVPSNWKTNDGVHRAGHDAAGNPINGTPKAENSATIAYTTVPQVTVTAPGEEGEKVTGVYVIAWTAHDPDGDDAALKIDIYLSADGGKTWEILVSGLANSGSYAWDTSGISAGDNYQLKVMATDPNALSGKGESPIFSVSRSD